MVANGSVSAADKPSFIPGEFAFEGAVVRTVYRDGMAWLVANDVCDALEIRNPRDAVGRLFPKEKSDAQIETLGGIQELTVVNEGGVYALIFSSRKPRARKFREWVTSEVLPSIRRTGRYEAPGAQRIAPPDEETYLSPPPGTLGAPPKAIVQLPYYGRYSVWVTNKGVTVHEIPFELAPMKAFLNREDDVAEGRLLASSLIHIGALYRQGTLARFYTDANKENFGPSPLEHAIIDGEKLGLGSLRAFDLRAAQEEENDPDA